MDHEIEKLCNAIADLHKNCDGDLCGEQRRNYNPRIETAMIAVLKLFPAQAAKAIVDAKLF